MTLRWVERGGLQWIECDLPGARAIFTTRAGGVSGRDGSHAGGGDCRGLNLGFHTPDDPASVRENRRLLTGAIGARKGEVTWARQVHGVEIEMHGQPLEERDFAGDPDAQPPPGEADAQVARNASTIPLVFVADCLPVGIVGTAGNAMVHCGRRPLDAGIIGKVVELIGGTAAVIGPGIGPCCYEVGNDVQERFASLGANVGNRLDLAAAASRLLHRAGVDRIQRVELCTSCHPDHFYSHRRERGSTGRQAGLLRADSGDWSDA